MPRSGQSNRPLGARLPALGVGHSSPAPGRGRDDSSPPWEPPRQTAVAERQSSRGAAYPAGVDGRGADATPCPLDLPEAICDPGPSGCDRWPAGRRLLNLTTGELCMGRCRATNLCRYCQRVYVRETVEMLVLDAMEHAPTLWLVLTAREHLTRADTYAHLRQLRRATKRRWPEIEWFVQVEFQRRGALHLNLLVKGVPVGDRVLLHALVCEIWCSRVDAEPVGQWSGAVEDGVGVVKYISKMLAHGLKAEQAPPLGWRGHRTSQTRGYLVRPPAVMRREARESLHRRAVVARATAAGASAYDAELQAHESLVLRSSSVWVLATDRGAAVSGAVLDRGRIVGRQPTGTGLGERRHSMATGGQLRLVVHTVDGRSRGTAAASWAAWRALRKGAQGGSVVVLRALPPPRAGRQS